MKNRLKRYDVSAWIGFLVTANLATQPDIAAARRADAAEWRRLNRRSASRRRRRREEECDEPPTPEGF